MKIIKKIQEFLQTRKLKRNKKNKGRLIEDDGTGKKYKVGEIDNEGFNLIIGTTRASNWNNIDFEGKHTSKGKLIDVLV